MDRKRAQPLRSCLGGVEAVQADTAFTFGRHTHEQFGIGLIERGAQKSASGRGLVEAGSGDIITVNPGEVHDGAPIGDGGRAWRMLYADPAIVAGWVADMAEDGAAAGWEFTRPAVSDPAAAGLFRQLFRAATGAGQAPDRCAAEERMLMLLARLMHPHGTLARGIPAAIAQARARIDDDPATAVDLATLARQAGLSRYQLLRGFQRATGLTPHAYQMQRRIHRARRSIAGGAPLAQAAADNGFADQSHMTRLFVRSFGMTPGAYAQALV